MIEILEPSWKILSILSLDRTDCDLLLHVITRSVGVSSVLDIYTDSVEAGNRDWAPGVFNDGANQNSRSAATTISLVVTVG